MLTQASLGQFPRRFSPGNDADAKRPWLQRRRRALVLPPMPITAWGVCMNQCRAAAVAIMPFIFRQRTTAVDSGSRRFREKTAKFASGFAERSAGAKSEGARASLDGSRSFLPERTLAIDLHSKRGVSRETAPLKSLSARRTYHCSRMSRASSTAASRRVMGRDGSPFKSRLKPVLRGPSSAARSNMLSASCRVTAASG